jgi:PKD repeat protein
MGSPINICDGGSVTFSDYSTPGTTSWDWTFEGGVPATSNEPSPVVTYATTGLYNVTLVVSNGTFSDTLVKDDYVWVEYCTDVNDNRNQEVSIYPNPASDFASVSFGSLSGSAELVLTDALGKTVLTLSQIDASKAYTLDLSGLSEGMYFATITAGGQQAVKKIVVRK